MNPNAPMIILSPLVDPDGVPMQGLAGEPLAADEQGVVYTLRDDGPPDVLGELAADDEGRLILIPMSGLGAGSGEKEARIQVAKCRRAMARGRRKHWERKVQHLIKRVERGQTNGSMAPRDLARLEREKQTAVAKLEQAKAREANADTALATANNLPLSGDSDDMAGDDDMGGLAGRKRFGKKFLKRAALMAFTGGAAAPFLAASRTRAGRRTFGRFLNDDGTDPMMAGDEMPVSTQVAGMGDIGSWRTTPVIPCPTTNSHPSITTALRIPRWPTPCTSCRASWSRCVRSCAACAKPCANSATRWATSAASRARRTNRW